MPLFAKQMILSWLFLVFISTAFAQNYRIFDSLPIDMIDESQSSSIPTLRSVGQPASAQKWGLVANHDKVEEVMEKVSEKLVEAREISLSQLRSVLLLNSSRIVNELKAKMDGFHDSLIGRLKKDLIVMVEEYKNASGDLVLEDEDKYEFTQNLQEKWEKTLSEEIQLFQEKVLPRWVYSVRNVWSGIEHKVMEKIKKFYNFLKKMAPKSISSCEGSNSSLKGSKSLEKSTELDIARFTRFDLGAEKVPIVLFVSFVAMIIAISLTVPFFPVIVVAILLIDIFTVIYSRET